MPTARRHRSPTVQLELPLRSPPAEAAPRRQADWHLDEQTRRIGRRGVAAARALLEDRAGTDGGDTATRVDRDAGHDHGKAGRAA